MRKKEAGCRRLLRTGFADKRGLNGFPNLGRAVCLDGGGILRHGIGRSLLLHFVRERGRSDLAEDGRFVIRGEIVIVFVVGDFLIDHRNTVTVVHAGGAHLKVIIECCLLTEEEKVRASRLTVEGGADFVKTSTGFSTGGATVEDVRLMRETVGPDFGVKAAGGIRTLADAEAMIEAGANRLGVSASIAILSELDA